MIVLHKFCLELFCCNAKIRFHAAAFCKQQQQQQTYFRHFCKMKNVLIDICLIFILSVSLKTQRTLSRGEEDLFFQTKSLYISFFSNCKRLFLQNNLFISKMGHKKYKKQIITYF